MTLPDRNIILPDGYSVAYWRRRRRWRIARELGSALFLVFLMILAVVL